MSPTQAAVVIPEVFGPAVIQQVPIPTPRQGEILVKVISTALNPIDFKQWKHNAYNPAYPLIPGVDLAGEVIELGPGASEAGFKVGDRVFGPGQFPDSRAKGLQQNAILSIIAAGKVPLGWSYDEAASIITTLITNFIGFYQQRPHGLALAWPTGEGRGKYRNTPIVILGGSSSLGQGAIQFAKLSGFSPIITTAATAHVSALKDLGADVVVNRSSPTILKDIQVAAGKPIDYVIDAVAVPETTKIALEVGQPTSHILTALPFEEDVDRGEHTIAEVFGIVSYPHNIELGKKLFFDVVPELLENGHLKPQPIEVLPGGLNGAAEGLERIGRGEVSRLKLIVRPQETTI